MKQIKFRAWDGSKMIQDFIRVNEDGHFIGHTSDSETYTPMQFTGLLDKTGKEIYWGDVVKIPQRTIGRGDKTKWKDFFHIVEFNDGQFDIGFGDYGEYRFRDGLWWEVCEVVGNIYENKGLIS